MKNNLPFSSNPSNFLYGLDGTDLIVAVHDSYQDRIIPDGLGDISRIHSAVFVNRDRSHPVIYHFEGPEGSQNGVMFNVRGNDVFPLITTRECHPFDGMIDRFSAVGSKDHFFFYRAIDQLGYLFPGQLQCSRGLVTQLVLT